MKKLCLGLNGKLGTPEEQLRLMAETGFDAYFDGGNDLSRLQSAKEEADRLGLVHRSLHAPFGKAAAMWHGNKEESEAAVKELLTSLDCAARTGAPTVVVHAFIGFDTHDPNAQGIETYGRVVRRAEELGLKLALENTEGEEYLASLMNAFRGEKQVGFCLDTGHEMCYNEGRDLLALYGSRLIATHLNDNLGVGKPGHITWLDDLHLLPFDGIADWEKIVSRLKNSTCPEYLTFELNTASKPGRHENDVYAAMAPRDYLSLVYERACRVRDLFREGTASRV
ncbi:MAG: sugar phosphate isomerase/epimerase [Lachnospiraceae bacterium]|nr:sugar phosphate isomerase/epimerase [Lachnospiraceae bacterium]